MASVEENSNGEVVLLIMQMRCGNGHSKISPEKFKELFPHQTDCLIRKLQRGDEVNVLTGVGYLLWHPESA